jgi:hypothetical protein
MQSQQLLQVSYVQLRYDTNCALARYVKLTALLLLADTAPMTDMAPRSMP